MEITVCFFCSSRRRHTRCLSDWSSDVCSSDLHCRRRKRSASRRSSATCSSTWSGCRPWTWPASSRSASRSEERRVGKSVDLGGRRIIKKKKKKHEDQSKHPQIEEVLASVETDD